MSRLALIPPGEPGTVSAVAWEHLRRGRLSDDRIGAVLDEMHRRGLTRRASAEGVRAAMRAVNLTGAGAEWFAALLTEAP